MTSPLSIDKKAVAQADSRVQRAARWFWWIAGLSLINTVILATGGNFNFVLGLGVTQIAEIIFRQFVAVSVIVDVLALGFFVAMGALAARGHLWAFIVGGIVYLGDGIIFAVFGDWLPVAFHAYALYCLFQGWNHLREALREAREQPEPPPLSNLTVPPPSA